MHQGLKFEYVSFYDLSADAWTHEVMCLDGDGHASIVIPDATPDGPFTAQPDAAALRTTDVAVPVVIIERLITAARAAGDIAKG